MDLNWKGAQDNFAKVMDLVCILFWMVATGIFAKLVELNTLRSAFYVCLLCKLYLNLKIKTRVSDGPFSVRFSLQIGVGIPTAPVLAGVMGDKMPRN